MKYLSHLIVFAMLSTSGMAANAASVDDEIENMAATLEATVFSAKRKVVCDGHIPNGWITVDKTYPYVCGIDAVGSPAWGSAIIPVIERYANKKVGTTMYVCSSLIPKGWKLIDSSYGGSRCGGAIVRTIQRIK